MLSHEANRLMTGGHVLKPRLRFPTTGTTAMNTLAAFWPHPELAPQTDPLAIIRSHGATMSAHELTETAADGLGDWVVAWESSDTLNGLVDGDWDILVATADLPEAIDTDDDGIPDDIEGGADPDQDQVPALVGVITENRICELTPSCHDG